jgi:hypothetical protein
LSGSQPSWAEVIRRAILSALRSVVTSQAGVVVAWNRDAQTADVRLVCDRPLPRVDGTLAADRYPILADVPVLFLQGGGSALTYELAEGDGLLVVALQWSIRDWLQSGKTGLPSDTRNHHLAHAVAIPCLARAPLTPDADHATKLAAPTMLKVEAPEVRITGTTMAKVFADEVRLGDDSATSAALASKVDTAFANVVAALSDPTSWAGVTTPPGAAAALAAAFTAAFLPTLPGPPGPHPIDPTPAAKVKIT